MKKNEESLAADEKNYYSLFLFVKLQQVNEYYSIEIRRALSSSAGRRSDPPQNRADCSRRPAAASTARRMTHTRP